MSAASGAMESRQVTLEEGGRRLLICFPYDRELVALVKSLPQRTWDREQKQWRVPLEHVAQVVGRLHGYDFTLEEGVVAALGAAGLTLEEVIAREAPARRPFLDMARLPAGTWTVGKINHEVNRVLRDAFREAMWVAAEIQGFDRSGRGGHAFFELVERPFMGADPSAKVAAVMWEDDRAQIEQALKEDGGEVRLRDGLMVRLLVKPDFYAGQGRFQVAASELDLAYTTGTIHQQREAVLRVLDEAGIAAQNIEIPWPACPLRVALVTSDGSDGCEDFLHELGRSGFAFEVALYNVKVQGSGTEPSVVRALEYFSRRARDYDVLVVVRGGGARSDLAYFDTERIGRAVCEHPLKVLVGIGHQRDRSLLDMIAHSEKTPTAAAQSLVARVAAYQAALDAFGEQIGALAAAQVAVSSAALEVVAQGIERAALKRVEAASERVGRVSRGIARGAGEGLVVGGRRLDRLAVGVPAAARLRVELASGRVEQMARRLDGERLGRGLVRRGEALEGLVGRLGRASARLLERGQDQVGRREERLHLLDPARVLERGFALVRAGQVLVRSPEQVGDHEVIEVQVSQGRFTARREDADER
jgi:exodeoxyribonuclease VII large subunit